jgi:hypothetical protein
VVHTKFGADWTNGFRDIQLLVKFLISMAAILDFEKCHFGVNRCMPGGKMKLWFKFCENRTDGSEVIQVFVNFKIAVPPSWIPLFSNFRPTTICSIAISTPGQNLMHLA